MSKEWIFVAPSIREGGINDMVVLCTGSRYLSMKKN